MAVTGGEVNGFDGLGVEEDWASGSSDGDDEQDEVDEVFLEDIGAVPGTPAQHAWDLGPARKAAAASHLTQRGMTSIDFKIAKERRRLPERTAEGDSEQDTEELQVTNTQPSAQKVLSGKTFASLKLSKPLLKAVETLGWTEATPIQAKTIPYLLAGRDLCASAVTGSGKTAAFALPILERLIKARQLGRGGNGRSRKAGIKVVMVLPTRELAVQCQAVTTSLAKFTDIQAAIVVGGLAAKAQEVALRAGPDILVATPGRLIDHLRNTPGFSLEEVEILVMDEADRLLELGFKEELEEVVRLLSKARNGAASAVQTILYSATMTKAVEWLVQLSLQKPLHVTVDPMFDVASTLTQEFIKIRSLDDEKQSHLHRAGLLLSLVTRSFRSKVIVFFRQKAVAHRFKIVFGLAGLTAVELHGNLTQLQRLEALETFRDGTADFLLATDLAARGLDILGVETVINYDMPRTITDYVHRVGRTARAGAVGRSVSLVGDVGDERKVLKEVKNRAKGRLAGRKVPGEVVEKWRQSVADMEPGIIAVLKQEKEEKVMRVAEMEMTKANNLLAHESEIFSRPAKTWFTNKSKEAAKKRKRDTTGGDADAQLPSMQEEDENGKSKRVARKEKKRMDAKKQKRREELEEREKDYAQQRGVARRAKRTGGGDKSGGRGGRGGGRKGGGGGSMKS